MRKPLINPGIIKRLKSFFAIIQDTDTATRYIPAGKYVLYKNIACHASQNIESGDTLALGTNLVTDSDGFVNCLNDGLRTKVNTSDIVNALTSTDSTKPLSAAQGKALNDSLTTLNSNIAPVEVTLSGGSNVTINKQRCYKTGKLLYVFVRFTVDATISQYGALLTLPSGMVTASDVITPIFSQYSELRTNSPSSVYADDNATTIRTFGEMPAGAYKINTVLMLR